MSGVVIYARKGYPAAFGTVQLTLQAYEVKGSCVLTERGTADGLPALTASYSRGTRLTLRGSLSPVQSAAEVTAALAKELRDGTARNMTVEGLVFFGARLCAYQVSDEGERARAELQFYTASVPVMEAGEGA